MLDHLKWRYATKKFDTTKKVSPSDLETLKEAVNLTASSYGLQAYKVLNIVNPEVREKLKPASWNQPQITDASNLFVFCAFTDYTDKDVDEYVALAAKTRGLDPESLKGFGDFLKGNMNSMPADVKKAWLARQPYLALGNLMTTAASMKIDVCPMEGFDVVQYNEILGLNEKGLSAVCIGAVGYRSAEDEQQHWAKVRKDVNDLFETV